MKETVDKYTFVERFDKIGRGDDFSRSARFALFGYLEQLEEAFDCEFDFDPVALCCEWGEWESVIDWAKDYFTDLEQCLCSLGLSVCDADFFDDIEDSVILDYLNDHTQVIEFDGGVLVVCF